MTLFKITTILLKLETFLKLSKTLHSLNLVRLLKQIHCLTNRYSRICAVGILFTKLDQVYQQNYNFYLVARIFLLCILNLLICDFFFF